MRVYHGTSNAGAKAIEQFGFVKKEAYLSIDRQGQGCFIEATFVSPDREIAHIYESNNRPTSDGNTGDPKLIEVELTSSNIYDLTKKENQRELLDYLKNEGATVNDFLSSKGCDGIRQIHKNDFDRVRLEYAIINLDVLKIVHIPKKSTKAMSLYSEAMLPDTVLE